MNETETRKPWRDCPWRPTAEDLEEMRETRRAGDISWSKHSPEGGTVATYYPEDDTVWVPGVGTFRGPREEPADETDQEVPTPKEDLKPRGEKAQFWLGPAPTAWHVMILTSEGAPVEVPPVALQAYTDAPGPRTAAALANSLVHHLIVDLDEGASLYESMEAVVAVFEYGARKYAPGNYREAFRDVESMRREYTSAIQRHWWARATGQVLDPESGLAHQAHAAAGAMILLEGELTNG